MGLTLYKEMAQEMYRTSCSDVWQLIEKLRYSASCARYMEVPPFEAIENRIFRIAVLKKLWMAFSTDC
jgi:hypothetical protein